MSQHKPVSIERRIERLWYGGSVLPYLLLPFAWVFRLLVAVRRLAYQWGLLRTTNCGVPVIVVGNITVGGAGKTPLVGWIAQRLAAEGQRVGIVSRGYGGQVHREPCRVTPHSDAGEVGDEPLLLAEQTSAVVCVCTDRVAGARYLVREAGVEIIVCDDGLQHYRLARDMEIAVIDGQRGLGNRCMLPAGPLREPPGRLGEVDFVFVNGGSGQTKGRRFELQPGAVRDLAGGKARSLATFDGRQVWAVAGIGNPERFAVMLRAAGVIPELVDVPDHGTVSLEALRREQPWPILMTMKDAVKYRNQTLSDAWYVPVDVELAPADAGELTEQLLQLNAHD